MSFVNLTIATFNRLACTRLCLESIVARTRYPYVLTIIDNGSTDGTREYLEEVRNDPRFAGKINRIVFLDRNMGISPAYNLGWVLSDAPYYMKIDNDVVFLRDDWLEVLVRSAETAEDAAMLGFGRNASTVRHAADDRLHYVSHVGGCTLISRNAHEKIGFWNEDYGLYGEEDSDFGLRARLAGFCNLKYADGAGDFIRYVDDADADMMAFRHWKDAERKDNLDFMFLFNDTMFKCGFREPYVGRMYLPVERDGSFSFKVNREYLLRMEDLKRKYSPYIETIRESEDFKQIESENGFDIWL